MNCRQPNILVLLIGLSAVLMVGCSEGNQRIESPPVPEDPTRTWVEKLSVNVDEDLRDHAEARVTGDEITTLLDREARRGWYDRLAGGIKYADLFQELYAERQNRKAFARSSGLTARGEAVLKVLHASESHALDPAPYHVGRVSTLSAELARSAAEEPEWKTIRLEPVEAERLISFMKERELDPHAPDTKQRVLDALLGLERVEIASAEEAGADEGQRAPDDDTEDEAEPQFELTTLDDPPAPRIIERLKTYEDTFERSAKLTAELELRVADGALRYARDMRHFSLVRQDWRDIKRAGGSKKLIYGRLAKTFGELTATDPDSAAQVLADLEPSHPQYDKLVSSLARYRAIAASGGWERVRAFEFEPGSKHSRVPALRERLAREGFIEAPRAPDGGSSDGANTGPAPEVQGEANNAIGAASLTESGSTEIDSEPPNNVIDDVIDDDLVAAVKSYQESHQFRPNGESSGGFWRSINVPVEKRIEQIELSLQRWRESRYRNEKDFIHVNIPDFHAEVWFDHERTMRFRVVTGNNQRKCDPETKKWVYPNATPMQMADLNHLILNPYWNVPKRIVDEEIKPAMKKDPKYLEKNDYEFVPTKNGREWVRQRPGEKNALGRVKFIFPNPHNTYMHDTPRKKYFDYSVRAFSHGCVRVQDPLELAEHLLEQDKKGDRAWMDDVLESDRTLKVEFDRKIPVFFEYATVRVDEQGRTNFLADIYRKDRRRFSEDPEEFDSCRVKRAAPIEEESVDDGDTDAPVETDVGP